MRHLSKPHLALVLTGLGLAGLLTFWRTGQANPIPPSVAVSSIGFPTGCVQNDPPEVRKVYVRIPVSEKAAAIWLKLRRPILMPFANETPLEDVLKYIRSATKSDDLPKGIPIYVDPYGLLEADRTLQSPITMDLEGVPLALTLRLALKQLDLDYEVLPEGLLRITYIATRDIGVVDLAGTLLNEVEALREEARVNQRSLEIRLMTILEEVHILRDEVRVLRDKRSSPQKKDPPQK